MIRNFKRTAAIVGVVAASSATLVACGDSNDASTNDTTAAATNADTATNDAAAGDSNLTGTTGQLVAEGATSQQNAMDYFGARYAEAVPGANLAYNATGSGAGVKNFIGDQAAFAGSDSPLKDDEVQPAADRCGGNEAWHLPMVIGPVAIAYNLDGVEDLNLTVDNLVDIFKGDITSWNDPAIAEANPGAELPDENISVIYRSDESGTSDNFQKFLAAASDAVIVAFNVRAEGKATEEAGNEGVEIRYYSVIYQAIDDVEAALKGMLKPVYEEREIGAAEIRQIFKASAVGLIAGCMVTEGKVRRNAKCRLVRDGNVITTDATIQSLRREKDDVTEVDKGYECGMVLSYPDIQVDDEIQVYEMVEVPRD